MFKVNNRNIRTRCEIWNAAFKSNFVKYSASLSLTSKSSTVAVGQRVFSMAELAFCMSMQSRTSSLFLGTITNWLNKGVASEVTFSMSSFSIFFFLSLFFLLAWSYNTNSILLENSAFKLGNPGYRFVYMKFSFHKQLFFFFLLQPFQRFRNLKYL